MTWRQVNQGDGGRVEIDDSPVGLSYRYTSSQFLGSFRRRTVNSSNVVVTNAFPDLLVVGGGGIDIYAADSAQFYTPLELNAIDPARIVFLMSTKAFETFDRGDTVVDLGVTGGTPTAAAPGGRSGGVANAEVLYVGTSNGDLLLRTTSGGALTPLAAYPGAGTTVRDVALDPADWRTAVVVNDTRVYITRNA